MAIKFFCYACGKKVSVPDGVAARQGHCPRCRAKLTIPDASGLVPPLVPPTRGAETAINDHEDIVLDLDRAEVDRFPVSAPDAPLASVPPLAQPSPQETIDEPPIPLSAVPSAPSVLKFNCAKCGQRIGVSADLVGQSGVCPRCGATVTAVALPPSPDMTAPMIRPPSGAPTEYGFKALTDAERRRIEEEERARALARVQAEEEVRAKMPSLPPRTGRLYRIRAFLRRRPRWSSGAGDALQAGAALKSYIGASVVVFILYDLLLWPIALVFNLMWLSEAERMQAISGVAPPGKGALRFMLSWCLLSVACSVLLVLALLGQLPSTKQPQPPGTPHGARGAPPLSGGNPPSPQPAPSHPEDADALLEWGNERYLQGDRRGAIADYDATLRINPRDTDALMNRGNARAEQGDLAGALSDYSAVLQINPQDVGAFVNRGLVRSQLDDLPGAIADYTEALRISPTLSMAYNNRGRALYKQGNLAGAIADYDAALKIDPQNPRTLANRAYAHCRQGDLAGAIADYRLALQVAPSDWPFRARVEGLLESAYVDRGVVLCKQGDFKGAIADYDAALKIDPQNPRILANRGDAHGLQGDFTGAIADYLHALQRAPSDSSFRARVEELLVSAYDDRGLARFRQSDFVGAIADYDAALEIDPRNPRAFANRGDVHVHQGELDDASADYDRALQEAPVDWELRQTVEEKRDRVDEQRRKQREGKKKHEDEARHLLNWARSYVNSEPQKAFDSYSKLHNEYADTDSAKEGESEFKALKERLNK